MSSEKSQNVQDVFLNHVRKNKTPVTVFLVNGVKLQGIITWFDNFCVLLRRDAHSQLVYKHAISTVMPAQPIQLFEAKDSRRSLIGWRSGGASASGLGRALPGRSSGAAARAARARGGRALARGAARRGGRASRARSRSTSSRAEIVASESWRPGDAARQRHGRDARQERSRSRRVAVVVDRCRGHAGAAAQSRARLEVQGDRPHRPDPRDLRRARPHP